MVDSYEQALKYIGSNNFIWLMLILCTYIYICVFFCCCCCFFLKKKKSILSFFIQESDFSSTALEMSPQIFTWR